MHVSDRDGGTTGTFTNFTLTIHGHDGGSTGGMTLSDPTLAAGASSSLDVSNANPNATTWLASSTVGTGSFPIAQLGVTLGLSSPQQLGSAQTTNGSGDTSFLITVPSGASGIAYWMQALQSGQVSNVIDGTVQ